MELSLDAVEVSQSNKGNPKLTSQGTIFSHNR
jgi:hypothetical protein